MSWPSEFPPQQTRLPSVVVTQVVAQPQDRTLMLAPPVIIADRLAVGTAVWPWLLSPQQVTLVRENETAHAWPMPTQTSATMPRPGGTLHSP